LQYGENLVLLVQTNVMVFLLWHFNQTKLSEKASIVALSLLYLFLAILWLPEHYWYLLHAFNDVIIMYSGGLQVWETYRVKHTGAQSIVTTSMNLIGEVLRIFTTLEETGGDWNMLLSFGLCATLSITMFGQYFWYHKNTELFYAKQQQQQQKAKSE
jgi:mannose-P-dolichol utilization defect 1